MVEVGVVVVVVVVVEVGVEVGVEVEVEVVVVVGVVVEVGVEVGVEVEVEVVVEVGVEVVVGVVVEVGVVVVVGVEVVVGVGLTADEQPAGELPMASRKGFQKPKGQLADLPIDRVVRLPELQMRAGGTDPEHVEALAEVVRDKDAKKPPRVQIRRVEGKGDLLTDGFHTVEAYLKAGRKTVPANVLNGTWQDAVADAAKANAQHDTAGKRRTNADKRRQVEAVLAQFPAWASRKVADHVGVSHTFVDNLKKPRETPATGQPKVATLPLGPAPESGNVATEPTWRDLPVGEFPDAADYVRAALNRDKILTAGQLFAALARGWTGGLTAGVVSDLMDAVKGLDGFDGRLEEGAGRTGPRPGSEAFNWNFFDGPYGAAVRAVDAVAERYPAEKGSARFKALMKLFGEIRSLWDDWQKQLTNKREAA